MTGISFVWVHKFVEQCGLVVGASGLWPWGILSGCGFKPCHDTCCFLEQESLSILLSTSWFQKADSRVNLLLTSSKLSSHLSQNKFVDLQVQIALTLYKLPQPLHSVHPQHALYRHRQARLWTVVLDSGWPNYELQILNPPHDRDVAYLSTKEINF